MKGEKKEGEKLGKNLYLFGLLFPSLSFTSTNTSSNGGRKETWLLAFATTDDSRFCRNGIDTEEEIYRVTYYGKGRMPVRFLESCYIHILRE